MYEISHTNAVIPTTSKNVQSPAQEKVVDLKADPSVNESKTLDDLSKLLEDELNQTSKEDLEKWAKIDQAKEEQIRLKKLNEDYGKEY